jgi:hypothetical protein
MSRDHDVGPTACLTRWWAAAAVLTTVSGGTSKPRYPIATEPWCRRAVTGGKHVNEGDAS